MLFLHLQHKVFFFQFLISDCYVFLSSSDHLCEESKRRRERAKKKRVHILLSVSFSFFLSPFFLSVSLSFRNINRRMTFRLAKKKKCDARSRKKNHWYQNEIGSMNSTWFFLNKKKYILNSTKGYTTFLFRIFFSCLWVAHPKMNEKNTQRKKEQRNYKKKKLKKIEYNKKEQKKKWIGYAKQKKKLKKCIRRFSQLGLFS